MAIEAAFTGEVDRTLPHAEVDGTDIDVRLNRYRAQVVSPDILTKHVTADEGTYFVTNNAQTGLATAAAPTAFSATNPFLLIYNTSAPADEFAPRIYLDYLMLLATAAGTGGTNVQFAITIDRANRYSSGGTDITSNIKGVNQSTSRASGARVYAGNITATAATANARTIVGNRFMKGAVPVAGDQYVVRCGAPDLADMLSISTILFSNNNVPPVVCGPDESLLVHLWLTAQSAASSYAPELGYWEK